MDVLSHALWGYAALRWRSPAEARWGALAGAAPDLLYFLPSKAEQILEKGREGLWIGSQHGIWRADGPPLPPELIDAYHRYYVWTHSLVILALAVAAAGLLGARRRLWLALPYAVHVVMDLPTHERYLTPIFYPFSSWTVQGVSWGHPMVFYPNWIALAVMFGFLGWRRWRRRGG